MGLKFNALWWQGSTFSDAGQNRPVTVLLLLHRSGLLSRITDFGCGTGWHFLQRSGIWSVRTWVVNSFRAVSVPFPHGWHLGPHLRVAASLPSSCLFTLPQFITQIRQNPFQLEAKEPWLKLSKKRNLLTGQNVCVLQDSHVGALNHPHPHGMVCRGEVFRRRSGVVDPPWWDYCLHKKRKRDRALRPFFSSTAHLFFLLFASNNADTDIFVWFKILKELLLLIVDYSYTDTVLLILTTIF